MARGRLLIGTIGWVVGYLATYLVIIYQQGESSPAWWYVALLVAAIGLLGFVAAGRLGRRSLVAATVVLAFATFVALLSIGVFLIPALVAAMIAASRPGPTHPDSGRRGPVGARQA
jgi:hypothetical protein